MGDTMNNKNQKAIKYCPQAKPINNSSVKLLIIPKFTHHPTNKKPHECGA